MSQTAHPHGVRVAWTGNLGQGTAGYRAYSRAMDVMAEAKNTILASSDPDFRGDATRWSPEDLFVAALSQCHLLWYLHLCADAGIVVTAYVDEALGTMETARDGSGRFTEVLLRPRVTVAAANTIEGAVALHADAHAMCFLAQSVSF